MVLLSFPGITFFTSFPLSSRTYQVVDAVVDALTSQSPRDRYQLGYDARFFFVPITLSSDAWCSGSQHRWGALSVTPTRDLGMRLIMWQKTIHKYQTKTKINQMKAL